MLSRIPQHARRRPACSPYCSLLPCENRRRSYCPPARGVVKTGTQGVEEHAPALGDRATDVASEVDRLFAFEWSECEVVEDEAGAAGGARAWRCDSCPTRSACIGGVLAVFSRRSTRAQVARSN